MMAVGCTKAKKRGARPQEGIIRDALFAIPNYLIVSYLFFIFKNNYYHQLQYSLLCVTTPLNRASIGLNLELSRCPSLGAIHRRMPSRSGGWLR